MYSRGEWQHLLNSHSQCFPSGWVKDFRKNSRIRQGQVTKYVSSRRDNTTFEETVHSNEMFQKQIVTAILTYSPGCAINTDQMGCEHHINIRQTLPHKGEKTTEVLIRDLNTIMHCLSVCKKEVVQLVLTYVRKWRHYKKTWKCLCNCS